MKKSIFLWTGGPGGAPVRIGGSSRRNLHLARPRAGKGPGDLRYLSDHLDTGPRPYRLEAAAADSQGAMSRLGWPKASNCWPKVSK